MELFTSFLTQMECEARSELQRNFSFFSFYVSKSIRNVLFYIKQKSSAGDKFSFALECIITIFAIRWDSSRLVYSSGVCLKGFGKLQISEREE